MGQPMLVHSMQRDMHAVWRWYVAWIGRVFSQAEAHLPTATYPASHGCTLHKDEGRYFWLLCLYSLIYLPLPALQSLVLTVHFVSDYVRYRGMCLSLIHCFPACRMTRTRRSLGTSADAAVPHR